MNHHKKPSNFQALNLSLEIISSLRPIVAQIRTRDGDLAKQSHRAANSIALNLSEGNRREGADLPHLFRIAAGSADETRACLWVANAWGYSNEDTIAQPLELIDRLLAILCQLTH